MSKRGSILVTGGAGYVGSPTVRALGALDRDVVVLDAVEVNVGTGTGSSVLDVIDATEAATGKPVPYEIVDRRPGDPVATFADPTFAARTLGWRARYGIDEIIRTAYQWHRTQQ